jgi:hypothetical protein
MKYKYYVPYYDYISPELKKRQGRPRQRFLDPLSEKGQERERYYAWAKHRSQAHYRQESYSLSSEDWNELWTEERWQQRGRHTDSVVMARIDRLLPWSKDNVEFITRREQLRRNGLMRRLQGSVRSKL